MVNKNKNTKNKGWREKKKPVLTEKGMELKSPIHREVSRKGKGSTALQEALVFEPNPEPKQISDTPVAYYMDNGQVVMLRLDIHYYDGEEGKELAISGDVGYVMTQENMEKAVEDHWENVNLEDEYGYMADEQRLSGERRKQFLEGLARDLKEENYPFQITEYFNVNSTDYVYDESGGGQNRNDFKHQGLVSLIKKGDLEYVLKAWDEYHLKPTPAKVITLLNIIISRFPPREERLAKAVAVMKKDYEGTEGQDRKSYSDNQDRDSYTIS